MAKEYDFCDFINLKELNIFYKSIIGIFKSNNIYGIIIDENHVSFMPNIEEAKKFIRIINLYSAILMIEKNNKDYLPKFSFSNNHDNEVIINNNGKKHSCYVVTMKDIRIDGNAILSYKKCVKQLYSKVLKNGQDSEALDFNFQNLNPLLINDIAVALLGIHKLSSGVSASIKNYEEKFYNMAEIFFSYDNNKIEDFKGCKINNDFVEGVMQAEEAFYSISSIKKSVILYKQVNKDKKFPTNTININTYTHFSLIKADNSKKYIRCTMPKGSQLVLTEQYTNSNEINSKTNNVLIKPSIFEIRNNTNDIVCKYVDTINHRDDFKNAFLQNLEKYVYANNDMEAFNFKYESIKNKNEEFITQNDQIDLMSQVDSLIRLDKFNFLIEQINDLNYDREVFSVDKLSKIKKSMFLALVFANLNNFSEDNLEFFISAFKYQYAKLNKKELETELDRFSDTDKEKLVILMSNFNKAKEEFELLIKDFSMEEQKELLQIKSFFNDVELLATFDENTDVNSINNTLAKHLIKLSVELDFVFDILYEYILTENFAESRLQNILTHAQVNLMETEGKRNFALVSIESTKNILISKAMNFFERFKNPKAEQQEESSAVAAKARLSKVMIGRQIAREQQEKQS